MSELKFRQIGDVLMVERHHKHDFEYIGSIDLRHTPKTFDAGDEDNGQNLTSNEMHLIASKLDELNGTTQPSLLERVREFAGSLKALTDSVPTGSAYYGMNLSRASERAAYNVALNRLYDRFPELKDLSAGEQ